MDGLGCVDAAGKKGYPYFMIDFEAKAAAQYFALVLKTAAP